jgi:phosphatidylglycerophosphate synthase
MTTEMRAFAPLLPAVAVTAYFFVGFAMFVARGLIWGVAHDREVEARGNSILMGPYLRSYFVWVMRPIWSFLLWSGVSANGVTAIAATMGLSSGFMIASGHFALGGWVWVFSGILDAFDGRLARARGQVTPAGAAIDSVLDRYVDAAILLGLAYYFRNSWTLIPTLGALLGVSMVPYVRARGDAAGVAMKEGMMQRPERVLYLGGPVALSPVVEAIWFSPVAAHPPQRFAVVAIIFLAITSNLTAIGRFVRLIAALNAGTDRAPTLRDITRPDITRRDVRRPGLHVHRG